MTGWPDPDTVRTYITPGRVRVQHRLGDAILDVPADRLVLLDRATSTYTSASLRDWEARIAAALEAAAERQGPGAAGGAPDATWEADGDGIDIAGYACQRHHLFTRRELFPGEIELVEQELWVTHELELPGEAYEAYRRAIESLDRIGLDPRLHRPPGIAMRLYTRTFPEGQGGPDGRRARDRGVAEEVERQEVVRVERRPLPDEWFAIPAGYAPADSSPPAGP
jgi:hypothetical protein